MRLTILLKKYHREVALSTNISRRYAFRCSFRTFGKEVSLHSGKKDKTSTRSEATRRGDNSEQLAVPLVSRSGTAKTQLVFKTKHACRASRSCVLKFAVGGSCWAAGDTTYSRLCPH